MRQRYKRGGLRRIDLWGWNLENSLWGGMLKSRLILMVPGGPRECMLIFLVLRKMRLSCCDVWRRKWTTMHQILKDIMTERMKERSIKGRDGLMLWKVVVGLVGMKLKLKLKKVV